MTALTSPIVKSRRSRRSAVSSIVSSVAVVQSLRLIRRAGRWRECRSERDRDPVRCSSLVRGYWGSQRSWQPPLPLSPNSWLRIPTCLSAEAHQFQERGSVEAWPLQTLCRPLPHKKVARLPLRDGLVDRYIAVNAPAPGPRRSRHRPEWLRGNG